MDKRKLSRRALLRRAATFAGLAALGSLAAACGPTPTPQVVEKLVKETVVKEVTKVVEKPVTAVPAAAKPVTITYWGYGVGARFVPGKAWGKAKPEDYMDWQKETFEKRFPNVTVKVEFLVHDQTYFTKIEAGLLAGTQGDIVMGPISEAAKYIPRGVVSPMDDYLSADDKRDFSPQVMKEAEFDGKRYLWPWRLSYGGGIQVNGKILEERGVKKLLPQDEERKEWTFDQYLEIARACTFDRDKDGKIDVYGTGLAGDYIYQDIQFQYGFGAEVWNKDESAVIINGSEGVKGMQWMFDLEWKDKVALPGTASNKAGELVPLWLAGKFAMYPGQGAGGKSAAVEDAEAKGIVEFIWCMPPSLPDKDPGVMTNIHGYYVLKSKDAERTEWAHKFCEHLVRPEAIALSLASGLPPARVSFWGQVAEDPNMKVGVRMVNYMRSFGRRKSSNQIVQVLFPTTYTAVFSKQIGVKEGLDQLAAESTKLLQDEIAGKT